MNWTSSTNVYTHKDRVLYLIINLCARLAQLVRSLTANQKVLGSEFPAWSRVKLWPTFFRHTVRGQGR